MQLTRNTKIALIAFVVFDLLVASWLIYLYLLRSEVSDINELRELGATRYPEPRPITDFRLLNESGTAFTQADLRGQWSLVFFGFTSCPDICPLTMTELAQFSRRMDESAQLEKPQVIFVTVDPARDGIEQIADYMARFDDSFVGLTGTDDAIAEVAKQFFIAYSSDEASEMHASHPSAMSADGDYSISHNVHVSLVNPQGELHSVIRPSILSEELMQLYPRLISN